MHEYFKPQNDAYKNSARDQNFLQNNSRDCRFLILTSVWPQTVSNSILIKRPLK